MATITVWNGTKSTQIEIAAGTPLDDVLRSLHLAPAMPCGGNHLCGKCRVAVSGALSPVTQEERKFLDASDLAQGIRLACFASVEGDCTVRIRTDNVETLSWARMPDIQPDGSGVGAAVDIGTTTVAVRLYDCASGGLLGEALEGNRQASFGADVISRIGEANEGNAAALRDTICTQLDDMVRDCMRQANVTQVDRAVVTGNTTMLHFYEGLDASGIAVAPFTPSSLFGGMAAQPLCGAPTYLPPCIGSYVGADIVCALLASGMPRHPEKIALLADLGTNGEIALMKDGVIHCCSTAAGPAFEGAGLHQGMRASKGAITGVSLREDGTVQLSVLGGEEAVGICGSGILDALCVMLELEILDETGVIDEEYEGEGEITEWDDQPAWRLPGTQVLITQRDIRQIQLAKSAICAGIRTLLDHVGVELEDVEAFYVAGGFGHSMRAQSAAKIVLFPEELLDAVQVIGNGALAGAAMLLLDSRVRPRAEQAAKIAEELELSSSETFMDFYVDGMLFGEEE